MAQISKFIIGLIIVGLFVSVFSIFMAGISDSYDVEYDNSTLAVYDQMEVLTADVETTQTDLNEIKEQSGVLDIIGGIFSSAYNVLLTTQASFDVFTTMSNAAVDDLDIGIAGPIFLTAITAIVLVVIVFIIMSAIMKWKV